MKSCVKSILFFGFFLNLNGKDCIDINFDTIFPESVIESIQNIFLHIHVLTNSSEWSKNMNLNKHLFDLLIYLHLSIIEIQKNIKKIRQNDVEYLQFLLNKIINIIVKQTVLKDNILLQGLFNEAYDRFNSLIVYHQA